MPETATLFSDIATLSVGALVLLGAFFNLITAIGIVRLPDVYTRMHASTKAGTLGVGCVVLACAIYFASLAIGAKAFLVIAFLFLTAPVSGHLIGRAAYFVRSPLWERTAIDELRGCYDPVTHALRPEPDEHHELIESVARQRAEVAAGGSLED
jgi:multicomponent Na+:H+ antiporter subunit G